MEAHEEHHHKETKVIGLVPGIIFLVALAIVVVWYSMKGAGPSAW